MQHPDSFIYSLLNSLTPLLNLIKLIGFVRCELSEILVYPLDSLCLKGLKESVIVIGFCVVKTVGAILIGACFKSFPDFQQRDIVYVFDSYLCDHS